MAGDSFINVEASLAPLPGDDPAGPDSFDLPERGTVQAMVDRNDEEVTSAEWPGVLRQVVKMTKQTRDLWVAVKLMETAARSSELHAVVEGGQLLAGLLEGSWDDVHHKIDDYGFESRANTCASLTKIRDFIGPLRRVALFQTRLGSFSGEDLERFAASDQAEGYPLFRASLDQLREQNLLEPTARAVVDSMDSIRDAIRRSDAVLTANAGSETSTNFQPTYEALEQLRQLVVPYAGVLEEPEPEEDFGDEPVADGFAGQAAPTSGGRRIGGSIENRNDVLRALDAVADYYRVYEPSSPVPMLLKRMRQWVTMDFLEVVADLQPGTVDEFRSVLLSKKDLYE